MPFVGKVLSVVAWDFQTGIPENPEVSSVCMRCREEEREPLLSSPLPDYPWQVIGSNLFALKNTHYLLVFDYFSRFPEVINMSSTTSTAVIAVLKFLFARHGIPEIVQSDNGLQYVSHDMEEFAKSYGFQAHNQQSPLSPK